jgi:hypothetical protein
VRVSAHALRHTFALNYLRQSPGKLLELASLLGHESLDTTAIYTRPSSEELVQDLERSRLNVDGGHQLQTAPFARSRSPRVLLAADPSEEELARDFSLSEANDFGQFLG